MVIFKKTAPQFHNLRKRKRNYLKKDIVKKKIVLDLILALLGHTGPA